MICPECDGTEVRLVPVPWTRGAAWVKVPCICDGGYMRSRARVAWGVAIDVPAKNLVQEGQLT